MPVVYLITADVKPEQRERFLSLLNGVLDAMRHEDTFIEAVLHEDPGTPNRFMLYEAWQSHEDVMTVQLNRPYRKPWHDALPELLDSPRDISIWQPLRADLKSGQPGNTSLNTASISDQERASAPAS
ncbi:putative quinol monooxygenase [Rhodoligotrophos defluvii]|uniref:putative quinol monooxygenase n=1 Tax=Rhodoligotrophos defluvii TaxID=2561934 RepID=UPI0010C9EA25|nr:putative quinol monooxygenase [Rhodoligotrophos defluvii]